LIQAEQEVSATQTIEISVVAEDVKQDIIKEEKSVEESGVGEVIAQQNDQHKEEQPCQVQEEKKEPVAKKFPDIPVGKRRTFTEKMVDADEENQAIYNMLKNELMSYKKVSNRCTKVIDIFRHKGAYLAKVGLTGKTIKLHLALDPNEYKVTKYHHQDLGEKKKFEFVPLALKVKSPRSQKYAIELIAGVMEKAGVVKNPKYEQKDYVAEMKESLTPAEEIAE